MMELILGFAKEDGRVRAVILNGSRANPDAPRDGFRDYDIVFAVTEVEPFVLDRSWIGRFGEVLIMQTPDESAILPPEKKRPGFAFLMLFADGNRIDLTFWPVDRLGEMEEDSLSVLLLDKDGAIGELPPPSVRGHLPQPPTAAQFAACCNEFWWVSTYVAKGLWRRELPYAKAMLEGPVRAMLMQMLKWYVAEMSDYRADPGKEGKYLERHLPSDMWAQLVRTYPDGDYARIWTALFETGELFRRSALSVAERRGFAYNRREDANVTAYLRRVRALPR
jgi:aminoglycoside 6-adenylyltransferase